MPSPRPSLRLLLGALLLGALTSAGVLGCRRGRAGAKPSSRPAAHGLAAGHKGLTKALRAALADCQLGDGELRSCVSPADGRRGPTTGRVAALPTTTRTSTHCTRRPLRLPQSAPYRRS